VEAVKKFDTWGAATTRALRARDESFVIW